MDTPNLPAEDDQRRVTQPEAARLLGNVSLMTMWRWRHDQEMKFPESIEINNRIYFRRSEILAWRPPAKPQPGRRMASYLRIKDDTAA
jgi:predicted DNA-binding transcriptional regulator AlpA